MTLSDLLLMAQAIASGAMCGVIWFVQIIHYPLFVRLDGPDATDYAQENQRRTGSVVIPFMLVEGLAAAALAWRPPPGVPFPVAIAGVAIVVALWLSTALVQMPLHARLAREGESPAVVAALVRSNWLRTALWSARAALAVWMLRAAV
ncbi:MAG: hypothetical protein ACK54F_13805 [Planctomycetia bacterium]